MQENLEIGLLGAGGQADEAESYARPFSRVAFRAVDSAYIPEQSIESYVDILSPTDEQRATQVVAAVGAPALRKELVERWTGSDFAVIKSEESYVDESVRIGEGTIIAPGVRITTNVEIGKHSIINIGSTISHNTKLGDFTTVSPGAHIAGGVELGDGVFVGIGAIISNKVFVARGSVIGAGAVVLKDVTEENSVVVGVPARTVKHNETWLREI